MTLLQHIAAVSAVHGNDVAVVDACGSLTYSMLRDRSDAVARCLFGLSSPKGNGGFAVVILQRTVDYPVAILGALKAGLAYTTLSPANSQEYNKSVISDLSPFAIISSRAVWDSLTELHEDNRIPVVLVDELNCEPADDRGLDLSTENGPSVLIYTSGTTGNPKAVLHSLRSLTFLCESFLDDVAGMITTGAEFACVLDFCFLASVPDLFVPLMAGCVCRIVPENVIRDIDALAALLKKTNVIHLLSIGPVVKALVSRNCGVECYASTGGRMPEIESSLPPGTTVRNVYGMTEFGAALSYRLKGGESPVPIGKPVKAVKVYLLDGSLMPVEKGRVGEIFICSDGLALGYWNDMDLTRECFMKCPFESGKMMFRTGDYACELPTGDFLFCGRKDNLVKFNGVRLNLAGIENVALSCSGVSGAAGVVNRKGLLCLLYSGTTERQNVINWLKGKLPCKMMPAFVLKVGSIPVDDRGKTSKEAVERMLAEYCNEDEALDPFQEKVLSAMRSVLGFGGICLRDDFFDYGGDSLNVVTLISELPELPLTTEIVYRERTAERIAAAVGIGNVACAAPSAGDQILLSPFQKRVLES